MAKGANLVAKKLIHGYQGYTYTKTPKVVHGVFIPVTTWTFPGKFLLVTFPDSDIRTPYPAPGSAALNPAAANSAE